jgi:hypothetical protein
LDDFLLDLFARKLFTVDLIYVIPLDILLDFPVDDISVDDIPVDVLPNILPTLLRLIIGTVYALYAVVCPNCKSDKR